MENLIDFKTAKIAKEQGFDKLCNYFYYKDGVLDQGDGDNEHICLDHNRYHDLFSAPTVQEYEEWLEVYKKDSSYVPGVYEHLENGVATSFIVFDGKYWLTPGYEIRQKLSDVESVDTVNRKNIGKLIQKSEKLKNNE